MNIISFEKSNVIFKQCTLRSYMCYLFVQCLCMSIKNNALHWTYSPLLFNFLTILLDKKFCNKQLRKLKYKEEKVCFFFGEKTWEKTFSIVCVLQKYFYIIASFYTFVTHQLKNLYIFYCFIVDKLQSGLINMYLKVKKTVK